MKKRLLFGLILLTLVALVALPLCTACAPSAPEKDKIVIGASRPLSGPNAPIGDAALGPMMQLWEQKINAEGGIYVEEYGIPGSASFIIVAPPSAVMSTFSYLLAMGA